jgi:hypothetical protein
MAGVEGTMKTLVITCTLLSGAAYAKDERDGAIRAALDSRAEKEFGVKPGRRWGIHEVDGHRFVASSSLGQSGPGAMKTIYGIGSYKFVNHQMKIEIEGVGKAY